MNYLTSLGTKNGNNLMGPQNDFSSELTRKFKLNIYILEKRNHAQNLGLSQEKKKHKDPIPFVCVWV